jgi:hypothetical protein
MKYIKPRARKPLCILATACLLAPTASADVVTDWNSKANEVLAAAKLPPHPSYRTMAMVQATVFQAVNAITKRYPAQGEKLAPPAGASVEAAVAQASYVTLSKLVPTQQDAVDRAYQGALSTIPSGQAKTDGLAVGQAAATAILSTRAEDGASAPESYRPRTAAGVYVPTVLPAFPQWAQRKPWLLASASQFRPGPPPGLTSNRWARDYNEIKAIGARSSPSRSPEQTEIARFWEATGPAIYFPVALSVASAPGREVTQNARLLATAGIAMDDALTAVMEAKYHYSFWRPITAIRNGDVDGNPATQRDPAWVPLIDTPMHPEYPCAHCILAGSLGAVLEAELGAGPVPTLTTTSVTAKGAARSWNTIGDFVQEVASARIYGGVHFRSSTRAGTTLGKRVGELAAAKAPAEQLAQAGRAP